MKLRPDGLSELLYSPRLKARLVAPLLADGAPGPEEYSARIGIAPAILARWKAEAHLLAQLARPNPLSRLLGGLKKRTIGDKIRILHEVSSLEGEDRAAYLAREKLREEDLRRWKSRIEKALGEAPGSTGDERAATPPPDPEESKPATGLEKLGETLRGLGGKKKEGTEQEKG